MRPSYKHIAKRKVDGILPPHTNLTEEILKVEPRPEEWEHVLTGKQKMGVAIIVLTFIGFVALASYYDGWFMANF